MSAPLGVERRSGSKEPAAATKRTPSAAPRRRSAPTGVAESTLGEPIAVEEFAVAESAVGEPIAVAGFAVAESAVGEPIAVAGFAVAESAVGEPIAVAGFAVAAEPVRVEPHQVEEPGVDTSTVELEPTNAETHPTGEASVGVEQFAVVTEQAGVDVVGVEEFAVESLPMRTGELTAAGDSAATRGRRARVGSTDLGRDIESIPGMGVTMAARLRAAGLGSIDRLAALGDDDLEDIAATVGTFPVRLAGWVAQAQEVSAAV